MLRSAVACAFFVTSSALADFSVPLHACTMYSSRLKSQFDSCADFSVVNGRSNCTKTKGECPYCVKYPGDHFRMWLPDYLVEVTPHVGRSMFAEATAGAALNLHLKAATAWWDKTMPSTPLTSSGASSEVSHSSFWHVRILPVPFGKEVNTFTPLPSSRGTGIPTCYSAVSELIPHQWAHGTVDLSIALAQTALAVPACLHPLGAGLAATQQAAAAELPSVGNIVSSVSGVDIDGFPSGCARPVAELEAKARNFAAGADAWNPAKLCIGTLGPLLSRTGTVAADDPFKAALTAGVKFASLSSDFFGDTTTGGWQLSDKWQLIYPPSLHNYCFRPGQFSQLKELPFGVNEDGAVRVKDNLNMSGAKANVKSNTYVFAVWRRRETCEEPMIWRASYNINKGKNSAICSASSIFPE